MDVGGFGFFGDRGGLSISACLCPCLGIWLLWRYTTSQQKRQRQRDDFSSPDEFLKTQPAIVGSPCGDFEEKASCEKILVFSEDIEQVSAPLSSFPPPSLELKQLAPNNWNAPASRDLAVETSSSDWTPTYSTNSGTALLSTISPKANEKKELTFSVCTTGTQGSKAFTSVPTDTNSSITSSLQTDSPGGYSVEEAWSPSHECFSDESSDSEADYGQPWAMLPRPSYRPGITCSVHRYRTLGCAACNGIILLHESKNHLRAKAAISQVPRLDLRPITGENDSENTMQAANDVTSQQFGDQPLLSSDKTNNAHGLPSKASSVSSSSQRKSTAGTKAKAFQNRKTRNASPAPAPRGTRKWKSIKENSHQPKGTGEGKESPQNKGAKSCPPTVDESLEKSGDTRKSSPLLEVPKVKKKSHHDKDKKVSESG